MSEAGLPPRLWHACAMEHARQPDPTEVLALRHKLRAAGYSPIPLYGKTPPVYGKNNKRKGLDGWQNLQEVTREQIEMWSLTWPDAYNTGVLTRHVPVLDLDILNEEAARAVEDHVCGHYAERGCPLTRIGKPPKRAFPFRTDEPFKKFKVGVTAPSGALEEIEFLGDGEQLACFGIHPETGRLYRWHGGEPGTIPPRRSALYPRGRGASAGRRDRGLLVRDFGYTRGAEAAEKATQGQWWRRQAQRRRRRLAIPVRQRPRRPRAARQPARSCRQDGQIGDEPRRGGQPAARADEGIEHTPGCPLEGTLRRHSTGWWRARRACRKKPPPRRIPHRLPPALSTSCSKCSNAGSSCRAEPRFMPCSVPSPPTCCPATQYGSDLWRRRRARKRRSSTQSRRCLSSCKQQQ